MKEKKKCIGIGKKVREVVEVPKPTKWRVPQGGKQNDENRKAD